MKKHTILIGLVMAALFVGISSLQSQVAQAGVGAAADDQTTREIAELINQRHAG